jgi:hypothetical protein
MEKLRLEEDKRPQKVFKEKSDKDLDEAIPMDDDF